MDWYQPGLHQILPDLRGGGRAAGSTSAGCGPLCSGAGGSGLKAGVARVDVTPAVPASGEAMQGKGALPACGEGKGGGVAMGIGEVALGGGESSCAWKL